MEHPELASELARLAREDLTVRDRLAKSGQLFRGYHPEMRAVHRRNGDRLAEILDQLGRWPSHQLIGRDGSSAAILIAQHDIANPALIRRCRELYGSAVEQGEAEPAKLAQLEDRIRYFEGRHQWYGTHWGWDEDGEFGPWPPVEDPDLVDDRRSKMGLPPLAEAIVSARQRAEQEGRLARRPVD
ncbi:MAG: DUF6624 domain-containing protein [Actinomycetota bacterium]